MTEKPKILGPFFKQPLPFLFLTVAISVGPFILNQIGFDFGSAKTAFQADTMAGMSSSEIANDLFRAFEGAFLHTILEWSAFSAAFFTVILFFANFTIKREVGAPILGVAFFCAGCMDAFHTLAADRLIEAIADNDNLVPFTWAICRLFNALILIGSVSLLIYGGNTGRTKSFSFLVLVCLGFGLAAYGIIQVCATSARLPNTMFPDALITRPWDVAPLALYLFAGLYLFPLFHKKEKSFISYSILISVIPHVATQLHMAFGSDSLFDNHFNAAHFLKIIAYMVPFVGLSLEYIKTYRDQQISETRTHSIIESAQEGIVVINPNGLVMDFNPFAEEMFGYRQQEVLGKNVKMLMPEPYNSEHDGYLSKYLRTRQKNIIGAMREVEGLRKDGSTFPMELRVSEMNLGGMPFFGGSLRDISERKATEEKLGNAKRLAENAQAEVESINKALIQHLEDKRFLASIIENTNDAVIGISLFREILSWNQGAEMVFGYSPVEIIGENISILIPEDRKSEASDFIGSIAEGKKIKNVETIRIKKDGTSINVSLTISPIKDANGNIVGASTLARDITKQINAYQSQAFLASIVNSTEDAVIGKNLAGEILSWNQGAERIYGYKAEEIIGENILILIPDDRKLERDNFLEEIKTGEKIEHFETVRKRKDGTQFNVALTISPIKDANGNIIGASTLARDITRWKEAQKTLIFAKEEAEAANRAKSTFLANMSHEIRTPMNAILGYSQILLRNRNVDADQRKALETIDTSGKNLLDLINEVLDISKIEAGKMELQEINFNLNDLVIGISKMFELRCKQKQLAWKVEELEKASLVLGDQHKLRSILTNLISNAVKFTDSGEVNFKVTNLSSDQFIFSVSDTGRGISIQDQQHIFDPFFQEESGAKKGGTGLGLAISSKQLELMGSELKLESEIGKGSRFHFTLNLPKAVGNIVERSERIQDILYLAEGYSVKALVVDDVSENRHLLDKFLSSLKIDVVQAVNGKDSLEKVREYLPDIIFMDIRMPVMDGKEAIELIQKEFGKERFKIVVITASVLKSEVNPYKKMGVHEFITKPFRLDQIIHCIQNLLKVEFEYENEEPLNQSPSIASEPDYSKIYLSEELSSQLKEAVEISSITELERVISKLQSKDENCIRLAAQIKESMDKYDMGSIVKIIENLNHKGN